ncbi:multi antimicrobial extrusion family drug/sodium antiporters (plasmid) [Haloarcula marismortui ATCC 43049]|uniref:MATE family efflux transporter n=1 Tax=Haloarcula marismortui (strain ATCC 43049 / DSM 3752 / JCM 8966 / VKM B-1809) TaxID=272569 RepID=Q5V651_HALMA|nr:MATE family efflux transporter [Haloarcula marismortui]AAV45001.1 multi antimicrobial extrusion family drug/sodium antiporters [Haloarcula marismortui ATCC 43049]QCP89973.1 MATE family efflux transporter [Haloarcula marismortui ATCC 43049]
MGIRSRVRSLFKGPEEFDLTSGGIGKPLFFLSMPIVITNLFQTAYNLADTFWLGQYSTDALAAISFAFPMVFLLISLGMGISVAGSVLVAQFTGAGEEREAEYAASQTVTFAVIVSFGLGIVGYLGVDTFLSLMGASEDVLPMATSYMEVISLGLLFMFGFFVFVALMRGYGDTITPMLVMFGSVVLNIIIDPFLIFGWTVVENAPLVGTISFPELGIEGAAIATVFSRALALVVGLAIMFRGNRGVQIHLRDMAPDLSYLRRLVRIGLPASIEGTGRALSMNLLLVIVAMFPDTVVAAYGIGTRVFSVVFLPAIAVARGVETMTGQNMGADRPDRAAKAAGLAATVLFGVLSLAGVLVWFTAAPIADLFTTDPEVVEITTQFLRYVALSFGFIGIMRAYTGSFRGAGKTLTAAAISVLMLGVIRFPIAWFAAVPFGETGIWISFAVSNVAGAIIAYGWYRRGTWRDSDLTETKVDIDEAGIEMSADGD